MQFEKSPGCLLQGQIRRRKGIRPPKTEHRIDLRRPWPDPPHRRQHADNLGIGQDAQGFVIDPRRRERTGMDNADVYRCHACLSIPSNPDYGSLNLSQAVQLLAYEWRQALGGWPVVAAAPAVRAAPLADGAAVQGALAHWQAVLERIGFLDPAAPTKLMPRLNQLLNRTQLTADEVHILRGIARAAEQAAAAAPLPRTPAERGKQG